MRPFSPALRGGNIRRRCKAACSARHAVWGTAGRGGPLFCMHYPLHRFGGMVYTVILQRARPKVKHKAHSAAFTRAKNLHNLSYKRKDLFMEM